MYGLDATYWSAGVSTSVVSVWFMLGCLSVINCVGGLGVELVSDLTTNFPLTQRSFVSPVLQVGPILKALLVVLDRIHFVLV